MIKYSTIIKAKKGNKNAINEILMYYSEIIKKFSKNEEFVQMALISVLNGIDKFNF